MKSIPKASDAVYDPGILHAANSEEGGLDITYLEIMYSGKE